MCGVCLCKDDSVNERLDSDRRYCVDSDKSDASCVKFHFAYKEELGPFTKEGGWRQLKTTLGPVAIGVVLCFERKLAVKFNSISLDIN